MKQRLILTIIFGILATVYGFSQSITGAEYFLDNDPGVGGGIPITISSPSESIEQTLDITLSDTLSVGYHWLYIRSRDVDRKWSIVMGHKIFVYEDANPSTLEDQPEIAGLEYYIDTEPGVGKGTWIANTATIKDTIEEPLELAVAGLSPGYHKLYARSRDIEGTWSIPMWRKFYVFEDTVIRIDLSSPPLVAAEYYFDDEVPLGGGTPIPVPKGDSIEWSGPIGVTGLEAGEHHLLIRVQDSAGQWSIAHSQSFSVVGLSSRTNSPICQGSSDGEATISIIGGKPPFTFLWDDPEQQSDSTATGLKAGYYTATVTDAEGTLLKETVEITEYDSIDIEISTTPTNCKFAEGIARAVAKGDNPPFKYLWNGGYPRDDDIISNLRSGIYQVTVTDGAGCQNAATAHVNDKDGPQIDTEDRIVHLKCAGDNNGIIDPLISGGALPLKYLWSNGEETKIIRNLTAGTYELIVAGADTCMASATVEIEEPQPITFSTSSVEADCGTENGEATVSVHGGTAPYFLKWTGFSIPHPETRTGLGAGIYEVSVIDDEGCSSLTQVAVSEKGAPAVNVTSVTQSSCGKNDGSIYMAVAGATGTPSYNWKNEETGATVGTNEDHLTGVGPGVYSVFVSDGSGCNTYATATISAELPATQLVCLVTVDSVTRTNLIVWTKTSGIGIIGYIIYRETTSADVFDSIAYVPIDSLSAYTDLSADPKYRSWRYRIAAVNECGAKSRLSPAHKTMHLTVNVGLGDVVNLIWNKYEGFDPKEGNYKIWRNSPGVGWEMITLIPAGDDYFYSILDPTAPDADLEYYIEAVSPTVCSPLKAATYNSSRSNRKTKFKAAPAAIESFINEYNLVIYPNPSEGLFKLFMDIEQVEDLSIKVFDLSGKLVYLEELTGISNKLEHDIDLTGFEKGMYQLLLKTGSGLYNKAIIIR